MSAQISIPANSRYYTPEEYFHLECESDHKNEYLNGKIYAMPGASPVHELISWNLSGIFWVLMGGKACRVYGSNLRVKVEAIGLYTYPDLSIVCETERYFEEEKPVALLNPRVVIEILSDSTERYDRGRKFDHYRQIPSLREYVLVSQYKQQVEVYIREGESTDTWMLRMFTEKDENVFLSSIGVTLSMSDIYRSVTFPADARLADEHDGLPA